MNPLQKVTQRERFEILKTRRNTNGKIACYRLAFNSWNDEIDTVD